MDSSYSVFFGRAMKLSSLSPSLLGGARSLTSKSKSLTPGSEPVAMCAPPFHVLTMLPSPPHDDMRLSMSPVGSVPPRVRSSCSTSTDSAAIASFQGSLASSSCDSVSLGVRIGRTHLRPRCVVSAR